MVWVPEVAGVLLQRAVPEEVTLSGAVVLPEQTTGVPLSLKVTVPVGVPLAPLSVAV